MQNSQSYSITEKIVFGLTYTLFVSMFMFGDTNLANGLLFAQALLILVISNFKLNVHRYHIFCFQFCLYCYMTTFWALNGKMSIDSGNTIFRTLMVTSVLYSFYAVTPNNVRILTKIVMWGGYTIVIYTYFFYGFDRIMSMDEGSSRITNKFNNVNTIGMLAAIAIIIHAYYSMFEKFSKTIFLAIPALFVIGATQSRKAIIELVMGVVMLYFFKSIRGPKNNLLPIAKFLFAIVTIILLLIYLSKTGLFMGLTERMEGLWASITGEGEVDMSTELRDEYRRIGWQNFLENPIFGIGIGNSPIALSREGFKHTYTHNNFVEMLCCGGIVGFISYYSIFFYLLSQEMKFLKKDKLANLFLVWVICIVATDWGAVRYYHKDSYFILMIFFLHVDNMKKKYSINNRFQKSKITTY